MITTGEYLVSKSPLPAGTALQHFLAMQTGQGTVFASRFSVQIEEPRLTLVQHLKREGGNDYSPTPRRLSADTEKAVAVFTRKESLSIRSVVDELCVRQTVATSLVVRDLGQERLTVRQSDVLEMN